jgi:hypothetical protein
MPAAHRSVAALLVSWGLAACGGGSEPPHEPPPVEDTIFGDMVETKDKARAVEESMKQQKEERDRAIDAQTDQ